MVDEHAGMGARRAAREGGQKAVPMISVVGRGDRCGLCRRTIYGYVQHAFLWVTPTVVHVEPRSRDSCSLCVSPQGAAYEASSAQCTEVQSDDALGVVVGSVRPVVKLAPRARKPSTHTGPRLLYGRTAKFGESYVPCGSQE